MFRLTAYAGVAVVMLSLPLLMLDNTARVAPLAYVTPPPGDDLVAGMPDDRAIPVSRSRDVLTQQRTVLTLTAQQPDEVKTYTVQNNDTLLEIAANFGVTAQTVAYNNGVTDARSIHVGDVYRIPPMNAAIYKVKDGDTIDSVAASFKVDAGVIKDANYLWYQQDNFAAGKEILVPVNDSEYPNFSLKDAPPAYTPPVYSQPVAQPIPAGPHRLAWPVAGVITQYFWYGHTGVDLAAPYGTGIGASDDGVVSAAGWVAVGGLRVCVTHNWGMMTCYYHTSVVLAQVGQQVKKGDIIARIGMTGVTTGPHVHWEARLNGVFVNPLLY